MERPSGVELNPNGQHSKQRKKKNGSPEQTHFKILESMNQTYQGFERNQKNHTISVMNKTFNSKKHSFTIENIDLN